MPLPSGVTMLPVYSIFEMAKHQSTTTQLLQTGLLPAANLRRSMNGDF